MKKESTFFINRQKRKWKALLLSGLFALFAFGINAQDYCEPTYGLSTSDRLSAVSTDGANIDIEYTSNTGGAHFDETNRMIYTHAGQTFDITTEYVGGTQTVGIWIDWDNDGAFDDGDEQIFLNYATSPQSTTLTVPTDMENGEYRMRVRGSWNDHVSDGNDFACNDKTYGSSIDVTLVVGDEPTCIHPENLSVTNITTDSATLSWEGDSDSYNLEWGEAGFEQGEGNMEENVNTPFELEDIDPMTTYEFYVQSVCDDETSYWNGPIVFTTQCVAVADLPYSEDFDSYGAGSSDAFPDCWSRPVTYTSGSTIFPSIISTNAMDGNSLKFQSAIDEPSYAVSPAFEEDIQNLSMSFWLKREGASSGTMDVGVMSDPTDITTFELVQNIDPSNYDYTKYIIHLGDVELSGGNNYIAFRQNSESTIWYYFLDDFEVFVASVCEDANAGTPVEDEINICPLNAFTLEIEGSDTDNDGISGVSGQWESSTDDGDTWTTIDDANEHIYTVEDGIEEDTQYRFVVSCSEDSSEDISDVISVTINTNITDCYCETSFPSAVEPITKVEITDEDGDTLLDNSSSASSGDDYEDFTDITVELDAGESYSIAVEGYTGGTYTNKVIVFIDWNQDGHFAESESYQLTDLYNSTGEDGQQATGTIAVPSDAVSGQTRMRVMKKYNTYPESCNSNGFGQAEDYTVLVSGDQEPGEEDCEAPENLEIDDVTDSTAFVIWEPGMDPEEANGWEVVYGLEGFDVDGDEGTSIIVDEAPFVELEDLEADTTYDVYVRTICDEDENSDWTDPETFTTDEDGEEGEYCEGDYFELDFGGIDSFTTSDGVSNIDNSNISQTNGYADFTDMVVSQEAGESFGFQIYIVDNLLDDAGVSIYIDYNNNYEFDSMEKVYSSDDYLSNPSGTITIPANTAPGNYRLRVVSDWLDSSPGACDAESAIHDYTLTVLGDDQPGDDCEAPTGVEVSDITNSSATVAWDLGTDSTNWEVVYGPEGFDLDGDDGTSITVSTIPFAELEDLDEGTAYDVYVRAICDEDNNSDWVGPETFTTEDEEEPGDDCEMPLELETGEITDSTVDIFWTPAGDETSWMVVYGEAGFTDDFTEVTVTVPNYTIEGLDAETDYEAYVVAICDQDSISDATDRVTFTTGPMSVDNQIFDGFSFYPNPVENVLNLNATSQIENVEVFNLIGQKVIDVQPDVLQTQISTEALQSGVYLMNVTIDGANKTFRVIKK